jgi:hypothetical protein
VSFLICLAVPLKRIGERGAVRYVAEFLMVESFKETLSFSFVVN